MRAVEAGGLAFGPEPAGSPTRRASFLLPAVGPRRERLQYLFEGPGWTSLRLAADLLATCLAVLLGVLAAPQGAASVTTSSLLAFPIFTAALIHTRGLYGRSLRTVVLDAVAPLAGAVSVAAMVLLSWDVLLHGEDAAGSAILRVWLFAVPLVLGCRAGLALLQQKSRRRGLVGRRALVVGAGVVGRQIAARLQAEPGYGLRPVGYLDADPAPGLNDGAYELPVLGAPDELASIAAATRADHVIIAFSSAPDRGLLRMARRCEELGLEVSLVPRFFESITDRVALERLGSLPLLGLRATDPKGWQFRIKYALDRPIAALMMLLCAPVLAAAALAVKLSSPGPVLFRQRRVGRDGKEFDLLKFRSMRVPRRVGGFIPPSGAAPGGIEGDDRRTNVGRILRRTALDELPQLWNVVCGQMSLVGPRPERPEYVLLFQEEFDRYHDRHRVKSGITGWAQVHGLRGQTSLTDRIDWDNYYIENWSLWLDCKVLLLTLLAIVRSGEDA